MRLRVHLPEGMSDWESNVALFRIGRADTCALRFEGESAKYSSWEHAEFAVDAEGRAYVTDLGSSNGTYVDGVRISETTRLRSGMTVQIGTKGPQLNVLEIAGPSPPSNGGVGVPPASQGFRVQGSGFSDPGVPPAQQQAGPHRKLAPSHVALMAVGGLVVIAGIYLARRDGAARPQPDPDRPPIGQDQAAENNGTRPAGPGSTKPELPGPQVAAATIEPTIESSSSPASPPVPPDPWAKAKEQGLPAYRLIAVEDPQTATTWPLAGAVAVGPQALLTTADVGVDVWRWLERRFRVKVVRDSQDAGVLVERVRIHAAFQKTDPEDQLYFDMGLVFTAERLAAAATLASAAELTAIERGQPLACAAVNHAGEAFDRFQQLQPEWYLGKVFAVTALSPDEAGAPRVLHLHGALSDKSSGSPIFDKQGRLVALYCEAGPDDNPGPADRALHYAKLIEPQLIELGQSQTENPIWVEPVIPPTAPEKKESGK